MIVEIRMPEVAADMTEADVVGWLAAPGDEITQGDILYEIETDKSTVEVEAPATGTLKEIHVPAGETGVAVGALLAVMESAEEAEEDVTASEPTAAPLEAESPTEIPESETPTETLEAESPTETPEAETSEPTETAETHPLQKPEPTALARRIADQAGLDISEIRGSGARGRVLKADVEETLAGESSNTDARPALRPSTELIHLSTSCRFDAVVQVTTKLNEAQEGERVALTAALVRAIAMALSRLDQPLTEGPKPEVRATTRIRITDGVGSPAAFIQGAESMGLGAITNRLTTAETPSSSATGEVGLFHALDSGVDRIEAQLEAGQICAFGVGAVSPHPVVENGALATSAVVEISLCADPGTFHAETATLLLGTVRQLLESPMEMAL